VELVEQLQLLRHVSVVHPTCRNTNTQIEPALHETRSVSEYGSELTESGDELFEVDEPILVLVQKSEEAGRHRVGVTSTDPGSQCGEELSELGWVNTVLL